MTLMLVHQSSNCVTFDITYWKHPTNLVVSSDQVFLLFCLSVPVSQHMKFLNWLFTYQPPNTYIQYIYIYIYIRAG